MNEPVRDLHALARRSADVDLASLLKAKETARANLARENTAKNIATFNAATKALESAMQKKGQEPTQDTAETGLASVEAVRRYLDEQGFVVSKSAIDRHKRAGRIRPGPDGTYAQAAALKYAEAFLRQKSSGLKKSEDTSLQQRQLLSARHDLLNEQALLARRKREVEEGKYVLRSAVGQDLAARAMMLKTGLKQLATGSVSEWVHLVGGDPKRAPELLRLVLEGQERLLSDYARADSVVLVFDGPEEEGGPEEEAAEGAEQNQTEAGS